MFASSGGKINRFPHQKKLTDFSQTLLNTSFQPDSVVCVCVREGASVMEIEAAGIRFMPLKENTMRKKEGGKSKEHAHFNKIRLIFC